MDYRKKNLKPKPYIAEEMKYALADEKLMDVVDFYQQLRKNGFIAQNEKGIKSLKNCLLTSQGLESYLKENLLQFLQQQHEKVSSKHNLKEILKKQIEKNQAQVTMINLSNEETLSKRFANDLIERRLLNQNIMDQPFIPNEEQQETFKKMSNMLNTNELADLFQGRVGRLLDQIGADRERVVKAKSKNNKEKSSANSNSAMQGYNSMKTSASAKSQIVDGPAQIQSSTNLVQINMSASQTLVKSSGGNLSDRHPAINKRKETAGGNNTDSEDTGTNTRLDTRSPTVRSKDGGFNSHNLINAKLEQIQTHGGVPEGSLANQLDIKVVQPFDAIEESKDPKFDEMTMSKIDSDLMASEITQRQGVNGGTVPQTTAQEINDITSDMMFKKLSQQQQQQQMQQLNINKENIISNQMQYVEVPASTITYQDVIKQHPNV